VRMFVERGKYFTSKWNILDFCIVIFGYLDEVLGALLKESGGSAVQMLPMLRILRIARLVRAIRLLRFYPELYVMVRGFFGAMKAMFWGFVLINILLVLWSLVGVEIINPINVKLWAAKREAGEDVNTFCEESFSSVQKTCLLFFQTLVAGDSWGQCTIPIIMESPMTFLLFALALVSVSLGFMNLILAVIVDNAGKVREGDKEEQIKDKRKQEAEALQTWKEVIRQVDSDNNGTISYQELMDGYDHPSVRHTLEMIGVNKEDLQIMFRLMDEDGSGDLDYDEFIDTFLKAQGQDLRIYLMMTKLQMDSVAKTVKRLQSKLGFDPSGGEGYPSVGEGDEDLSMVSPSMGPQHKLQMDSVVRSARRAPTIPGSVTALPLEVDFERLNRQIQEQFAAIAVSIERNTTTLALQARGLDTVTSLLAQQPLTKALDTTKAKLAMAGDPSKASAGRAGGAAQPKEDSLRRPAVVQTPVGRGGRGGQEGGRTSPSGSAQGDYEGASGSM